MQVAVQAAPRYPAIGSFNPDTALSAPCQVMGALPQPLLVLMPDRRLLFLNASAEHLLAEGLGQKRSNHLMALGQLDAGRLSELLQRAAAGTSSRIGLWFTPTMATGWLHAAPLAAAIAEASDWPVGPEGGVLLAVHLDQPALTQAARIDALTRQCRLSQAERHVLMLLADGEAVEGAARVLGLCVSTVRTHVRNLLGKTQAPTLMQLVRWTGSASCLPH
jgi:DNA-binding CsgD family transcriptional regulator